MIINRQEFDVKGLHYRVRSAVVRDAQALSELRLQIDGETENLDREPGEAFIDAPGFERLIQVDTESPRNLFLVAVVDERIVGFSRCEGSNLKRFSHRVEFGIAVLKDFWGYGIGRNLLQQSVAWADSNGIRKIVLQVVETNEKAMSLYSSLGFEVEGILRNDRVHADGKSYNTVVMGRLA